MAEIYRQRLTILLLRAAGRNRRYREVSHIPLIPTAGGERRLSIEEIGLLAENRGGILSALDPDVAIDDSLAEADSTLVASAEVCGLLSELIDVRFQAPFHREHRFIDRIGRGLRHAAVEAWRRVRGIRGSRLVPASALRLGERQLLAALRAADPSLKVELCYGLGAVRRTSRGIAMPRDNPWLAAAAVCVEDDPSWAYPLLLVMGTGDPPSLDLRKRWRTACRRGEM